MRCHCLLALLLLAKHCISLPLQFIATLFIAFHCRCNSKLAYSLLCHRQVFPCPAMPLLYCSSPRSAAAKQLYTMHGLSLHGFSLALSHISGPCFAFALSFDSQPRFAFASLIIFLTMLLLRSVLQSFSMLFRCDNHPIASMIPHMATFPNTYIPITAVI